MAFYAVESIQYPAEGTRLKANESYIISFSVPYEMLDVSWNAASDNKVTLYAVRENDDDVIKEQMVVSGENVFSFRLSDFDLAGSGVVALIFQISAYIQIEERFYSLYLLADDDNVSNDISYREPIFTTAAGEPGVPTLASVLSRDVVWLSWSAGSDGTDNTVTGYDVEQRDSSDGVSFSDWQAVTGSPVTGTEISVLPPETVGNYRQFRVRTRGAAGSEYFSQWVESSELLRRKWDVFGIWEDPNLTAGVSGIRAVHITQLQERVNEIRAFYGMSTYGFTSVTPRRTKIAKWAMLIGEIRAATDGITTSHEAWNTLEAGRPRIAHITQLRRIIDGM